MSNREKIILVLMAAAILYGGYSLFLSGGSDLPSRSRLDIEKEELTSFVLGVTAALPTVNLTDTDKYILASAAGEWAGDPFLEELLSEKAEETVVVTAPEPTVPLVYSGFIALGDLRLAIVNGREYGVGEALELPGYAVSAIQPSYVELVWQETGAKITVPLEDVVGSASPRSGTTESGRIGE